MHVSIGVTALQYQATTAYVFKSNFQVPISGSVSVSVSFYVCLAPGGLRDEDGRATSSGADGRVSWTDGGRSVLYLPKSFTTECCGARRSHEFFL